MKPAFKISNSTKPLKRAFLSGFLLSGILAVSPPTMATNQCSELFGDSELASLPVLQKAGNTIAAPIKSLWSNLTYMEMPLALSHPLYKKIEERMTPRQAKVAKKSLYYTTNTFRKSYNLFASKGLGFPLPAIRTQKDTTLETSNSLPESFDKTYWSDVSNRLQDFSIVRSSQKLSKNAYSLFVLAISSLFALQTAGNLAEVAQATDILVDLDHPLSQSLPLKNNQIQLLNETVPFPHIAIRIGNMVYSHGVNHLRQSPVEYYLNTQRVNENVPAKGLLSVTQKLSFLKRSVDSVVLNLDNETVLKIRDQLLRETSKEYDNKTFVNSCASMIIRILSSQGIDIKPGVLDASPSLILSYLSLESLAGRKNNSGEILIAGFYNLISEPTAKNGLRNFMIRQMEAAVQLNVYSLPVHLGQRMAMDQSRDSVSDFYFDNPERQKAMNVIQAQAESDLHMIQEYDLFILKKQSLKDRGATSQELSNLKTEFAAEFKQTIEMYQAELKNPGISFVDYNLNMFKIDFLTSALAE